MAELTERLRDLELRLQRAERAAGLLAAALLPPGEKNAATEGISPVAAQASRISASDSTRK